MLLPDKQIIAVDFDGTLAETEYPTIIAPIPEIVDFIKSLKAKGNIIILWTCRHNQPLLDAVKWCKEQGIIFDYINQNVPELIEQYGECRKIAADMYIDDTITTVVIHQNLRKTSCIFIDDTIDYSRFLIT